MASQGSRHPHPQPHQTILLERRTEMFSIRWTNRDNRERVIIAADRTAAMDIVGMVHTVHDAGPWHHNARAACGTVSAPTASVPQSP